MFAKLAVSKFASLAVKRTVEAPKVTFVRALGGHAAASHGHDHHDDHDHGHHEEEAVLPPGYYHGYPRTRLEGDVVIPQLVDTLEWVLSSPPAVHCFNEPPIIVEIEHLDNLKYDGQDLH